MPRLVIGVVDTPLVEHIALVINQGLVEVAGFRRFVTLDLPRLFLHAGHLPTRFAQEITGTPQWILSQSRHLVTEHEGTTKFVELRRFRQRLRFKHEDQ